MDLGVVFAGWILYWADGVMRFLLFPLWKAAPVLARLTLSDLPAQTAKVQAQRAMDRLSRIFVSSGIHISGSDIPVFSILAHEALQSFEIHLEDFFTILGQSINAFVKDPNIAVLSLAAVLMPTC